MTVGLMVSFSSMSRQIASDDEYVLQTVTVFRKVRDDFIHKCRENKQVFPFFLSIRSARDTSANVG